jgi:hypothetical protein
MLSTGTEYPNICSKKSEYSFNGTEYRNIKWKISRYSVPLEQHFNQILQILGYSVPIKPKKPSQSPETAFSILKNSLRNHNRRPFLHILFNGFILDIFLN